MKKITHHPSARTPSTTRGPRPLERRRANRGNATQGGPSGIEHLDEEKEASGLGVDAEVSLGHHHGEESAYADEETRRRLAELRNRDAHEFEKTKQGGSQNDGLESPGGGGASSAQHLTAELQRAAQNSPQRSIFGTQRKIGELSMTRPPTVQPSPTPPAPTRTPAAQLGARGLLSTGKPVGTYLRELPPAPPGGAAEHTASMAAVEEARRLLAHVEGVARVSLGENKAGQKVVVVVAGRGFSLQSLRAVPEKIQNLDTVISIAFDVLPLRRTST